MNKKNYIKPEMKAYAFSRPQCILAGSELYEIENKAPYDKNEDML